MYGAGLLACSPSGGGLGRRTAERAGCCPLRWGCWAVYGRARRLLPPSSGSILSGTSLKSFQRSHLGFFPKFLQRSQQLVWWKLPSSTYISREVHPVNILTPPHSTLAVCWITNPSSSSYVSQRVLHQVALSTCLPSAPLLQHGICSLFLS